ncbi:hypothetical protein H072_11082 [Dactylellina haptotyla CBS 200.50]|uniref:Uncharacterized protein n=1 Tax=Dactylellina haptotyla (strain CBS 200.50) TaxID=1284197 RepID=S8B929_DACHA|nr:hypothetical protein H072_11082 [Dactylellina haptotyla CBS 200.50]
MSQDTAHYAIKYTGLTDGSPSMPIYKVEPPEYLTNSTTALPAYEVARVNDKLQLTSTDPHNTSHIILTYQKKPKIQVRTAPESSAAGTTLETIPLEWYYHFSQPKLIDLKLPNGKLYRWSAGKGYFDLIDKTKNSASHGTIVARITGTRERKGIFLVAMTGPVFEMGSGLTKEIVLVSAAGLLKKCEKTLVQQLGAVDHASIAYASVFINPFMAGGTLF